MNLSLGVKVLVIVTCTLFSTNVATAAAWLSHTPGSPAGQAVMYGGSSFGGCFLLCLAVLKALKVL
ncbi:hypothetical protein [Streptomyces fuscichromogenes]|uniref:Uncharacterized protein n=1 Tax=Streptomyces fuscichromogenes TaxID=1324013 RepID=A0A917XJ05_9ACTN|nr:hypothetical protein [Streptomyces fuscichromogenes]GGN30452.1 hypothetical protein GCM10011578_067570 [Streptomyces fuscichromogenes]